MAEVDDSDQYHEAFRGQSERETSLARTLLSLGDGGMTAVSYSVAELAARDRVDSCLGALDNAHLLEPNARRELESALRVAEGVQVGIIVQAVDHERINGYGPAKKLVDEYKDGFRGVRPGGIAGSLSRIKNGMQNPKSLPR